MSETQFYTCNLTLTLGVAGDEMEVDMQLHYSYYGGCAATLETPADEPTVEVDKVFLYDKDGKTWRAPDFLEAFMHNSPRVKEQLFEEAAEALAEHADRQAEARYGD